MHYSFYTFRLDSDSAIVQVNKKRVDLSKQSYELLSYFVQNSSRLITRDELVENVWKGKEVTDNTIDRSLLRLKKILQAYEDKKYFKNSYGRGFQFIPKVSNLDIQSQTNNYYKHKVLMVLALFVLAYGFHRYELSKNQTNETFSNPSLIIKSSDNRNKQLAIAEGSLIKQLLSFSNTLVLKNSAEKPDNLTETQYIENHNDLSENTYELTSKIKEESGGFSIVFILSKNQKVIKRKSFKNKSFAQAFFDANQWLEEEFNLPHSHAIDVELIPKNSHLLNMYLKGLVSFNEGNYEKAKKIFALCLSEDNKFHLARFELAKAHYKLGKTKDSLALLDTLIQLVENPELLIASNKLYAEILYFNKDLDKAKQILLNLIEKYSSDVNGIYRRSIDYVKFDLIWIYYLTDSVQKALVESNKLIEQLEKNKNHELLADVYIKKAAIEFNTGGKSNPEAIAQKARNLFVKLQDDSKIAQVDALLSRIYTKYAQFDKALALLKTSLITFKRKNNYHGIAETLRRMVVVYIYQGQFDLALSLNQESEKYAHMKGHKGIVRKAKENEIIIAIKQENWQLAEILIKKYLADVENYENRLRSINALYFEIDLLLAQNNTKSVLELIHQAHDRIRISKSLSLKLELNLKRVKYLELTNQKIKAIDVLIGMQQKVDKTDDINLKIQIYNKLALLYIGNNDGKNAEITLNKIKPYKPFSYPYLLLRAKLSVLSHDLNSAIKTAKLCKENANEFWKVTDEKFLSALGKQTGI